MSVKPVRRPVKKSKNKPRSASPSGKRIKVETKTGIVSSQVVDSLPKDPVKGHFYTTIKYNGKLKKNVKVTFESTGKPKFGKYIIRRTEHTEHIE